jgi:aspartate racemase
MKKRLFVISNMKKPGLIGGISWASTIDYYRLINTGINKHLGGLEYADLFLHSLNYGDVMRNNESGNWQANYELIKKASFHMRDAGADFLVLCANTMHIFADRLKSETGLPVVHIAEATALEIASRNMTTVGLLGTKFTMEMDFFKDKLLEKNIHAIIPDEEDRAYIHKTIFDELGKEIIRDGTRQRYIEVMNSLVKKGAEGIILGCTEIPLLVKENDTMFPLFDTTAIHSNAVVEMMLS